jgi:hypothetical protein
VTFLLLSLSAHASGPSARAEPPAPEFPIIRVKRKSGVVLSSTVEGGEIALDCECTTSRDDDGSYVIELLEGETVTVSIRDAISPEGDVWQVGGAHRDGGAWVEWSREADGISMAFDAALELVVDLTFVSPTGDTLHYGPIIKIKPKGG